jgi:diguanylate cyclase (GGDEF)-like protein
MALTGTGFALNFANPAKASANMESLGYGEQGNLAMTKGGRPNDSVITPFGGPLPDSVLELSSQLQTTLEIDLQIGIFAREAQRQCGIDGLRYLPPNSDRPIDVGEAAPHRATYDLMLEQQSLGSITLFRATAYDAHELEGLENLLCAIIYPLRNALTYLRAVEMASRDPLTGIGNRRAMDQALIREFDLARRQATPLSLLIIDIDHFKRFNDQFGHTFGDDILVAVAQTIASTIRRSDLLYRFGGEEFVVLTSHTGVQGAQLLAERIRENIAAIRSVRGQRTRVTASVGIAALTEGDDEIALFKRADAALYEAKQTGRNRSILAD